MEIALLRNLPTTASCTVEIALTRPNAQGGFRETARLRPIHLCWKSPATLMLSFDGKAAVSATAPPDDFSTTACRGPYFDMRMERVFGALRGAQRATNRLNDAAQIPLGPLQIFLMTLRADATAKVMGRSVGGGGPALGMDFPNAAIALPIGFVAKRVQIWIGEKDGLPVRARLFTQRQGILTFDTTYAPHKDGHGIEYLLPDVVTLQPAVEEDRPSAAFPMRVYFTGYQINVEVPDAAPE
jgi:hypothetical protein